MEKQREKQHYENRHGHIDCRNDYQMIKEGLRPDHIDPIPRVKLTSDERIDLKFAKSAYKRQYPCPKTHNKCINGCKCKK